MSEFGGLRKHGNTQHALVGLGREFPAKGLLIKRSSKKILYLHFFFLNIKDRFLVFKPGVRQNIAFHASPAVMAVTPLGAFVLSFPRGSFHFIFFSFQKKPLPNMNKATVVSSTVNHN